MIYKVTQDISDLTSVYYKDLMKAINVKQKKKGKYHIYGMIPGKNEWFKLE